jgi:threonine/homoserine/homoserine lactone efflux protein
VFAEIGVFYRGLVLGLMIAAPVGPIGLLCIRRTIQKGLFIGFATGLGAAAADTLFGAIAALGIAAILDFMRHYDVAIRIVGGGLLMFGAWHIWHDRPETPHAPSRPAELVQKVMQEPAVLVQKVIHVSPENILITALKNFIASFAITLTNPVTMFAILAVVATFGQLDSRLDTATLVGGIFSGSALWWFILSGGVALVREHFTENRVMVINHVTATALALIATWAISTGLTQLLGDPGKFRS